MNKGKKIITAVVALIAVALAAFVWHNFGRGKNTAQIEQNSFSDENSIESLTEDAEEAYLSGDAIGEDISEFNKLCENGEWVKIAEPEGEIATVNGTLRGVYPEEELPEELNGYLYYVESSPNIAISGENFPKLDLFEDREAEIRGVRTAGKNELSVSEIRCSGAETDKNLIGKRKNILKYIAESINTLAPQKAPYSQWTVDLADFIDESGVYVEYYDLAEDDEKAGIDEDTSRKLLLETSIDSNGEVSAEILAYWDMGEDDLVLRQGNDKFEDVEDANTYFYDPDEDTWERID